LAKADDHPIVVCSIPSYSYAYWYFIRKSHNRHAWLQV